MPLDLKDLTACVNAIVTSYNSVSSFRKKEDNISICVRLDSLESIVQFTSNYLEELEKDEKFVKDIDLLIANVTHLDKKISDSLVEMLKDKNNLNGLIKDSHAVMSLLKQRGGANPVNVIQVYVCDYEFQILNLIKKYAKALGQANANLQEVLQHNVENIQNMAQEIENREKMWLHMIKINEVQI